MAVDTAIISDPKNVYYLSGFFSPGVTTVPTYLILFRNHDDVLVTGDSNVKDAEKAFREGDVVTFRNYDLRSRMVAKSDLASTLIGPMFEKSRHAGNIGVESWNIQKVVLDTVNKASVGSRFVDLSEQLESMRMVKDADEVANCKKSCRLVDYAYSVAESLATPGLSEVDLYAGVNHKVIQKAGGFQYFSGDFTAGERSIDAIPSGAPTDLTMKKGDTLVLDLWTTTKGYWADTCRTFLVGGHPSKEQRNLYRLVQRAMKAGTRKMRPGVVAGDVYRAVKEVFAEAGHGARFPHHAGHGVGLDAWERPYLIPGSRDVIEAGMVLALEPGVYLKGVAGIRLEDNFLVQEDSVVPLSAYPMGW
jgi:Xaa-Pro aminopeptidase